MRGSIEKRGNGYRVTIHLGYGEDGKPRRYREQVSTKKAAEAVLRAKLEQFETEGRIARRTVDTLEGYITRYLDSVVAVRVRSRTVESYREIHRLYIQGTELGRMPLKAVSVLDLEAHYSALCKRVSPDAVRRCHVVIRQALKKAVKTREIGSSPAVYVDLPRAKPSRKREVLPLEDFPKFVEAAMSHRLAAMWVLALATGMRPEEWFGLRWVDIEGCSVRVAQVLVRARYPQEDQPAWELQEPKTVGSARTIKVDEQVAFLLRRHRTQQAQEKLRAGQAYAGHDLVFCDELGEPLVHLTVGRWFKRLCSQAGLSRALTLYSLRHSAATALLRKRESLKVVAHLLGHSSIHVTGDVYSHVTEDLLDSAAATLGQALFG